MRSVAVAGHICLDLTPGLAAPIQVQPGRLFEVGALGVQLGGCVANTGGDLADLGLPVRAISAVGDDDLGDLVRLKIAARSGMSGDPRVVPGSSTSYSLVIEPPDTDRTFWHHVGANACFDGTEVDRLAGMDLLHLGYPPLLPAMLTDNGRPLVELLTRARAAGVTTSIDLAVVDPDSPAGRLDWSSILQQSMRQTDVISPSVDDLTSALRLDEPPSKDLVARLADTLVDWGAAVVAISSGSHGLYLRTASEQRLRGAGRALADMADRWADVRRVAPPLPIRAVTTNGAGDAGSAGLLYAIVKGAGPADAIDLSVTCAAATVTGLRTTPSSIGELRPSLARLFPLEDHYA